MNKLFYLFLIISFSCNELNYYDDEGIWIEDISTLESDSLKNLYNYDNKIFLPNIEYIFDYYQIKDGKKLKFSAGGWEYIDFDQPDNSTIMTFGIQTLNSLGMMKDIEEYTQSVIQFNMYDIENKPSFGRTQTGVIENELNVWIHPLRHNNFKILELNPFPFIKSPYEIGNKYSWNLKIGDHWADPNWKIWSGSIENKIVYEIVNKTILETEAGIFNVFVIDAEANSRIGKTLLTSYFNREVGFVKHEYTNIDSSKLVIELNKIRKLD